MVVECGGKVKLVVVRGRGEVVVFVVNVCWLVGLCPSGVLILLLRLAVLFKHAQRLL
jgi:hypothetical protein